MPKVTGFDNANVSTQRKMPMRLMTRLSSIYSTGGIAQKTWRQRSAALERSKCIGPRSLTP